MSLPPAIRALLWDHDDRDVSLETHRDFLIGRVLSAGDWDCVAWLRGELGDAAVRDYIVRTEGRLLSPRQLRLWQLLLDLPEETVTGWIHGGARRLWDGRTG